VRWNIPEKSKILKARFWRLSFTNTSVFNVPGRFSTSVAYYSHRRIRKMLEMCFQSFFTATTENN
jgi:hypothetical protein